MAEHYRKDSAKGITPPNPSAAKDIVQHITKHRGMKTPYTSISDSQNAIHHFDGVLYKTESSKVTADGHQVVLHDPLLQTLRVMRAAAQRGAGIVLDRAILLASKNREALIDWQFNLASIERKNEITHCQKQIQKYFSKV